MKLWGPLVRLARASTSSRWVLNPQKGKSSKRISATCAIASFLTFCLFSMSNLSENIFRHLPTFFGETNLNWHAQLHCEARLLKFNEKSQLWRIFQRFNFEIFFFEGANFLWNYDLLYLKIKIKICYVMKSRSNCRC